MNKKIVGIFFLTLMITPILTVSANTESENVIDKSPSTPIIEGPKSVDIGETCFYTVVSTDPQGDDLFYEIRYSDDPSLELRSGSYKSGEKITFAHCWDDFYQDINPFFVKVKAVDENGNESAWGELEVNINNAKTGNILTNNFTLLQKIKISINDIIKHHSFLFPLLRQTLKL